VRPGRSSSEGLQAATHAATPTVTTWQMRLGTAVGGAVAPQTLACWSCTHLSTATLGRSVMPLSFGAGIMPPANAGWSGPLLGEDTCGCGHLFRMHLRIEDGRDWYPDGWFYRHHYECDECECLLNQGLEFITRDDLMPDAMRWTPE